ncbi:oxidoreductase [Nannochloropsis oceanica]
MKPYIAGSVATMTTAVIFLAAAPHFALGEVQRIKLAPGPAGMETSQMGLGALHFAELTQSGGAAALKDLLNVALQNKITLLDLADIYAYNASAELVGQAFALQPGLREKFQIVYKTGIVFPDAPVQYLDNGAEYMMHAVDIALTQLGTTYLDVLMPHAPDPLLDATELAMTFKKLKASGKVRYFGVSNFPPSKLALLQAAMEKQQMSLTTAELEISVLTPTALFDGRLDQLQELGIAALAWGPLGGDPMAGANRLFNFPEGARQGRILAALKDVASQMGPAVTPDQVAIAWLLRHPTRIVPVIGTVRADRLKAQAAATNLKMTRAQWTQIMGASAVANFKRWEQLNDGQWHDVANDSPNTFGSPLGVDVPVGFCDFGSCKAPMA